MNPRLARTQAMNARLARRPEPVRPEWVRITRSTRGWDDGAVVAVDHWHTPDVPVINPRIGSGHTVDAWLYDGSWEPADPPVDDPPQPCEIGRSDGFCYTHGAVHEPEPEAEPVDPQHQPVDGDPDACSCGDDHEHPGEAIQPGDERYYRRPPEPAAETWKEGDWFTIPSSVAIDADDVTGGKPYEATGVDSGGLYFIDDTGEPNGVSFDHVDRCDPPVVDEPAPTWKAGDRVHRIHHGDGIVAEVRPLRGDYCVAVAFMRYQNQRLLWFRPEELTAAAAPDPEMVAVTLPRDGAVWLQRVMETFDGPNFNDVADACCRALGQEGDRQ